MDPIPVLQQIAVLFLLMAAGYAANRCGVMDQTSERHLSRLIVNITCPALILDCLAGSAPARAQAGLGGIFATAAVYFLLLPPLAKALARLLRVPRDHRTGVECMLIYSNLGFMGIPVLRAMLGADAILYLTVFMAVFNISIFSYGILLLQKDAPGGGGPLPLARMVNPGTVSAAAALILYALDIQLPALLAEPVSLLGNTTTPLAMVVIGSSLTSQPMGRVLRDRELLTVSLCRLLVLPALAFAAGRLLLTDPLLLGTLVVVSGMPVASNTVMLCSELGRDGDLLSRGVFYSTLLSMVTIPLVATLLGPAL